jgi:hypothetical protein
MSEEISARISILDNQIVDADGVPIGRVDDLELRVQGHGAPEVVALLTGSRALGARLGGAIGRAMVAVSSRLRAPRSPARPTRIDPELIAELEPSVRLRASLEELPEVAALERWLAENVIEKFPGVPDADL